MCKWSIIHFFIVVNWKLKMTMMMMITSQFQGVEIIFWLNSNSSIWSKNWLFLFIPCVRQFIKTIFLLLSAYIQFIY